ncbi:SCO family protein [Leptobacterium sp. I13]|uniref:SCO family protein n=1 Tax=Leptobacterium meishanense TaxID=3128904 RepID=UPI0030EE3FB9
MKKYSYIGISLVILVFGIWAVPKIVSKFTSPGLSKIGKVKPFNFINQRGEGITNETYRGKVYVVEFFFTTCPTICPIMNRNMVQLQDKFYGNPNFGIASFSINPKHDTPEILNEYAERYKITHPHWHLLTGDKDEIYKLANGGFNLYVDQNVEAEGGFEHSGLFALIDKEGYIRSRNDAYGNPIVYYDGLEQEGINMLKEDIEKLLKEE